MIVAARFLFVLILPSGLGLFSPSRNVSIPLRSQALMLKCQEAMEGLDRVDGKEEVKTMGLCNNPKGPGS